MGLRSWLTPVYSESDYKKVVEYAERFYYGVEYVIQITKEGKHPWDVGDVIVAWSGDGSDSIFGLMLHYISSTSMSLEYFLERYPNWHFGKLGPQKYGNYIEKEQIPNWSIVIKPEFEISNELKTDRELFLEAVKKNGLALYFANKTIRSDREIVFEAVKTLGVALCFASKFLRSDREIVLQAVKSDGWALQYASKSLKSDRSFILEAINADYSSLKFASKALKSDREIVLEAVKLNGWTIQFASKDLKSDKDLFLEVVKVNGLALEFASKDLKSDREIVIEAVKNRGDALEFVSKNFNQTEKLFLRLLCLTVLHYSMQVCH